MTAETTLNPATAQLKQTLAGQVHARKASLTDVEQAFLHALLVDEPASDTKTSTPAENDETELLLASASKRLDDDVLFSVPEGLSNEESPKEESNNNSNNNNKVLRKPAFKKDPKLYRFLVGLWQAHEDGVGRKDLGAMEAAAKSSNADGSAKLLAKQGITIKRRQSSMESETEIDDAESVQSDQEVRTSPPDDVSDCSWEEEDGGFDHFDAWQVLKDEYAKESGFDYSPDGAEPSMDESCENHTFKILGTSADDISAHPHVLSPPLIDSLMNFVPEHLEGQNMWMKYSLVRDGACLNTFKQYARASKDSILAIETTKGDVFGCYTSSAWRTTFSFFGGAPSFVWRMRHGRNTPCHSLIEQAQLESEIDVYFLLDGQYKAQCLTSSMIGVGEGDVRLFDDDGEVLETGSDSENDDTIGKNYGFAIALQDDLLSGTTSKCSSYTSPCLGDTSSKGEPFEVLNLELWAFTPCFSLDSAEKLEMTQFFVSESMRNASTNSANSDRSQFSSSDFVQDQFYRRVGQGDDHSELRERWQYRNMMDGGTAPSRGIGASPRFNNA
mmetsp:Transcript_85526/g.128154  ORF Transcript_85526/g.128154 Transcript_85526/m.128154 type:complete len:557 (+) Transcript_85526:197-1867(+)|eukprot:CAMPEP_0117008072 /NCGR_PEP_ID=MMETSP0472-20121206/7721_1 /TAXON_ID=693140 ORGANISM="Tiarina fusus, Strain LIS" /NCGR_SAMPLE_ID=MMETSP0472 /ASSEMBLY_ACC=CAM_ASM_000603 /LENGTH=556 /DNA_ID=CAMNT_0004710013 /DNA_START=189 /DNA_END=1859 /DNA_ORIENTATION=-